MPTTTETIKLTRPAKKAGGDRYENDRDITFYVPQRISRPNDGQPVAEIEVTFVTKES